MLFLLACLPATALAQTLTLASTTSTEASGLFDTILPAFESESGIDVRVVAVSSGAHKGARINWEDPFAPQGKGAFAGAYGQSKLANIMHMRELQRRLPSTDEDGRKRIRCVAVTPGAAWTAIMPTPPLPLRPLMWAVMRTPTVGAQVIKMACLDTQLQGGNCKTVMLSRFIALPPH